MSDQIAANTLTFEVKRVGDAVLVRCHGRLVAGVNNIFYDTVSQQIPGTKRLVLDLKDITRMDSMGLGALVRLYVSARSAGCSLELIHLAKQIHDLLGTTRLLSVFAIIGETGIKIG
ncbi:MAG TPA: STAS domain-containing protein [Acidobacteriaceae bacterium]|jgi:anti-sigma B factor antagonist|nr:STAS domain-containing protein [Acidobacteriaceae bacterium]